MLSLLRWGLGSGHEHHLTDKAHMQEEGRLPKSSVAMTQDTVKRKRGKSTQSVHRPAKRHPKESKNIQGPAVSLENEANENAHASESHEEPIKDLAMEWSDTAVESTNIDLTETDDEADKVARLREAISRQFNLEILLKHNELRLIDQEIAKVQVALEQLRRCSIIPYPSMTSNTDDILNVAHAQGLPAPPQPGKVAATQPPPWGVVDGPYSRHYAKWLLPDPVFDGGYPESVRVSGKAGKTVPERHTRGGKEISLPMTKPRQRAGMSRYQAVSGANGEHKDTKGPMILKRALDGKFVKLVCPNCHRENFNSAQGFINHCRIAHSHNLASHEAAARECGQEIDPNEVVETAPETATPTVAPQQPVTVGLVHPMNRPQMPLVPKLSLPKPKRTVAPVSVTARHNPMTQPTNQSFKPSSQVPHLSRLFAKLGKSVDLIAAVEDATVKEDLLAQSDEEDESYSASESEDDTTPTAPGMARIPSRISTLGGPSFANGNVRPKSRKGPERAVRRPYTNNSNSTQITLPDRKDHHDLSPNTITSVNAPSLISDSDNASSEDEYASDTHRENSSEDESSDEDGAAMEEDDIDVDMNHELPLRNGFEVKHTNSNVAELRAGSKARGHHTAAASGRPRVQTGDSRRGKAGRGRRKGK